MKKSKNTMYHHSPAMFIVGLLVSILLILLVIFSFGGYRMHAFYGQGGMMRGYNYAPNSNYLNDQNYQPTNNGYYGPMMYRYYR